MVREKEHAVVTEAGKRADLGWESRGWKFTQEELMNPPSLRDNISMEEEKVLRKKSQVFVFDCCKVLQTKSLVMCAAMTICQRYFSQVSFRKINRVDAAAAAIFLAAKVEEFRVHINSVLIVTHQVRHGSSRKLDPASREFQDYRERLLKAENQLVNALGFDFMIEHPYSHSTDLMEYMIKEGEARDCRKRQLCVLCSGPGGVGGPVIIAPSERWGSSCVPIVSRSYLSTVFCKKKRVRHTRKRRRIFALGSTGLFKYSTRYLYHLRHAYFGPGSDYCFGPGSKYYVRQGVTYSTVKFLRDGFSMCCSDVGPNIRKCLSRTWCVSLCTGRLDIFLRENLLRRLMV